MSSNVNLEEVFEEYYKLLYRIVYSIAQDAEDTLDILQETFLRAYLHFDNKKTQQEVLRWLITISKNTAKTFIKQNKSFEPIENYLNRTGTVDLAFHSLVLYDLKKLEVVPSELFDYLMMNIIDGVPLLEISRKTNYTYEKLRYWRKILLKELTLWITQ